MEALWRLLKCLLTGKGLVITAGAVLLCMWLIDHVGDNPLLVVAVIIGLFALIFGIH